MKKLPALIGTATLALLLSACSGDDEGQSSQGSIDDGEQSSENGAIDHGVKDKGDIGFSLDGETVEEAANVPDKEKEAILKTFNHYIETLNDGDVDEYLTTLSTTDYDLDEERAASEELLANSELTRTPDQLTIVKYSEDEAQLFSTMETALKDKESGQQEVNKGRQVTVLVKEEEDWKVKSVHYIGDQE